jgi:phospholipase/carboxylesterase
MGHSRQVEESGKPLAEASRALIMLHGRGATAEDILSLGQYLPLNDYYIAAPQATNSTWYPFSFLSPVSRNEPWLTSALQLLSSLVSDIEAGGIPSGKIYLLGFSQGACLTLEFAARNARIWGGAIAFTGGLIGDQLNMANYSGNFGGTRIFIGNSDQDPHVPATRTQESADVMKKMGADVVYKVYNGMPHTINNDELAVAATILK